MSIYIKKIKDKKGNVIDKICEVDGKACRNNGRVCFCSVYAGNPDLRNSFSN